MPVRNQVKPDTILKTFWKNNQRFADLFNTVLFEGNPVLKPNDLQEVDTDVSSIIKFNGHTVFPPFFCGVWLVSTLFSIA